MHHFKIKKLTKTINFSFFRFIAPSLFICLMFYCLTLSFIEQKKECTTLSKMAQIPVVYNFQYTPNYNQNSIELAMALFSINLPHHTKSPLYLPNLPYRGLTTGNAFKKNKNIFIGKSAFTSWGILGSTLAHEAEVHANQSFIKIEFLNFVAYVLNALVHYNSFFLYKIRTLIPISYGTYIAEIEAYNYELMSKKRFHLSSDETAAIKKTILTDVI